MQLIDGKRYLIQFQQESNTNWAMAYWRDSKVIPYKNSYGYVMNRGLHDGFCKRKDQTTYFPSYSNVLACYDIDSIESDLCNIMTKKKSGRIPYEKYLVWRNPSGIKGHLTVRKFIPNAIYKFKNLDIEKWIRISDIDWSKYDLD